MHCFKILSREMRLSTMKYCINSENVLFLRKNITTNQNKVQRLLHINVARYYADHTRDSSEEYEGTKYNPSKTLMSPFQYQKSKQKETFLECLRQYQQQYGPKTNVVNFIKIALKYMDEFGVNKDLDVYKELLNLYPKGQYVPKTIFQQMFFYYIKEQYSALEVLTKMERNGVCPDVETEEILVNVFGKWGMPVMKCHKLTYWFPKFRNATPWPLPDEMPSETLELAKLMIQRITSVDLETVVTVYDTKDVEHSLDKTWIVSAMAPFQEQLLKKHNKKEPLFVEGPFRAWIKTHNLEYFILRAKPPKEGYVIPDYDPDDTSKIRIPHLEVDFSSVILYPTVHEQNDGIIMSVCATGTSTKDSLLSWIRCLQKDHPALDNIPIIFTLTKSTKGADDTPKIDENKTEQIEENR